MKFLRRLRSLWSRTDQRSELELDPDPDAELDVDLLFDADAYCRVHGARLWTFFAYPTAVAGDHGLPPHADAIRLLAIAQSVGIEVTVWAPGFGPPPTSCFACKPESMRRLNALMELLESDLWFGSRFYVRWGAELGMSEVGGLSP